MRIEAQAKELYQQLDAELNNFADGERFYTYDQLLEKFHTNRRVLAVTLERMEQAKLIRREPYVGIFCTANRRAKAYRVLFAAPIWPSEAIRQWCEMMDEFSGEHGNFRIKRCFYDPEYCFASQVVLDEVDALIVYGSPAATMAYRDLQKILDSTIPVIFINSALGDSSFCTVNSDDVHGGMLAADFLLRHGHRELLVAISEPFVTSVQNRVDGFVHYARLHGATVRVLDCRTANCESSMQHAHDGINHDLELHELDYTGLFVVSDESVPGAVSALGKHGYRVPEDVSVIGYDGIRSSEFFTPPLTTVSGNRTEQCKRMFEELARCLNQEIKYFRVNVPMHIIERDSVRMLDCEAHSEEDSNDPPPETMRLRMS